MDHRIIQVRKQKHIEYKKKIWLPQFIEKYKWLLHPKLIAIRRIQRFLRNRFFIHPINLTKDQLDDIPGIYRLRIKFNKENITDIKHNEDDLEKALRESLIIHIEEYKNIQTDYICLDLRIYGQDPTLPIYIADIPYYLTQIQINKIKRLWNKINSLIFQQDYEYYKCLSKDMKIDLFIS